ncbi:MAG: helix-turn-helix domain-containing protein [Trichloromonadaceae bacterium]
MLFNIGEQIRRERKRRKMSQATLAGLLGMSRTTISQIEHGTIQDVGIRKIIRILEVLELELRTRPAGAPPTLDELRDEDNDS